MDLPRELRNHVYQMLWEHTPHIKSSNLGTFESVEIFYKETPQAERYLYNQAEKPPSWLFTCKQILEEATEELRLRGAWYIRFGEPKEITPLSSMISPFKARRMYVELQYVLRRDQTLPEGTGPTTNTTLRPYSEDCTSLAHFVAQSAIYNTVGELTVIFYIDPDPSDMVCDTIDLSGFNIDSLAGGSLRKVSLYVTEWGLYYTPGAATALTTSFASSLTSLVRSVVGGDTSLRVEEGLHADRAASISLQQL